MKKSEVSTLRFTCLWLVPHRLRCRAYFFGLISSPHFGQTGMLIMVEAGILIDYQTGAR